MFSFADLNMTVNTIFKSDQYLENIVFYVLNFQLYFLRGGMYIIFITPNSKGISRSY